MFAPATNEFLLKLSSGLRDTLLRQASAVDLPQGAVLYSQSGPPRYAYFLLSGLASKVIAMPNGETVEIGLVGREGMVGGFHLLGNVPLCTRCTMQMTGSALRIPFADLQAAFHTSEELRACTLHFVQQEIATVAQIAACNRLHEAEQRLIRWLLMAQDRTGYDTLKFTQEYLAEMIGTQRTTVTLIAGELNRRGLMSHSRGTIRITDRPGLEAAACVCYRVIKRISGTISEPAIPGLQHQTGTTPALQPESA